jgi:RNA polymerase subunit RPABC4/transcription elongation factor Spt4
MSRDDFICPVCGATVPAKARACPECGSDEKTGWSDNTIYDGTGVEDPDEFDYEDWKRREGVRGAERSGRQKMIWLAALVMLLLVIFLLLR